VLQPLLEQFPTQINRENISGNREFLNGIRELQPKNCPAFDMAMRFGGRIMRHGSTPLNQREYCEAPGIPLKAFGNWRAKFKAEPRGPVLIQPSAKM